MTGHRQIDLVQAPITIRPAATGDDEAVARLAAVDSAQVPTAPLLVAEVNGELRAAVSLSDGRAIADPFRPTADLVALLYGRIEAARPRAARGRRPRLSARRQRPAAAASAP
jgi:hypothetical protein